MELVERDSLLGEFEGAAHVAAFEADVACALRQADQGRV